MFGKCDFKLENFAEAQDDDEEEWNDEDMLSISPARPTLGDIFQHALMVCLR